MMTGEQFEALAKLATFPADELAQIDFGVGASPLAGFAEETVEIAPRPKK